jgi:hypothetical protein
MAPIIEDLHKQYGGDVTFISVAGPWQGATIDDTSTFIRTYGSSWTYVYDGSGSVMNTFGVQATPTFVIIGRDGSPFCKIEGDRLRPVLAEAITGTCPP